jgi:hypothetical protein
MVNVMPVTIPFVFWKAIKSELTGKEYDAEKKSMVDHSA